jgi:hypothetical protein
MKRTLFIALFFLLFLMACNSQNKSKDEAAKAATEQIEEADELTPEEAIDDSGEATADDTSSMVLKNEGTAMEVEQE